MLTSFKALLLQALITVGIMAPATSTPIAPFSAPEPIVTIVATTTEPVSIKAKEEPVAAKPASQVSTPIAKPVTVTPTVMDAPAPTKTEPVVYAKPVNGSCGDNSGRNLTQAPAEYLCTTGDPTTVEEKENVYNWKCMGRNGGWDASTCQAYKTEAGVCGSLANTIVPPKFNGFTKDKLCEKGLETMVTTSGNQLSWQCSGMFGGQNAMCYAMRATDPNTVNAYQAPAQAQAPAVTPSSPSKTTNTAPKPASPTTYELPSKCLGLTPIGMAACISNQYPY